MSGITIGLSQSASSNFLLESSDSQTEYIFKRGLRIWCENVQGTPEFPARVEAARLIENCYRCRAPALYLTGFHLTSLPQQIGELQSLQLLELDNNQLSYLPSQIGELQNLRFLDLSDNQIELLPEEIGELQRLEKLTLNNNPLTAVPLSLFNLQPTCSIDLTGCPIDPSLFELYPQRGSFLFDSSSSIPPIR